MGSRGIFYMKKKGFHFYKIYACVACMHAKLLWSCPTLCDPMNYSPPGSFVHGILQTGILKWVAMPSLRGSSQPRDQTHISTFPSLADRFFYHSPDLGSPYACVA